MKMSTGSCHHEFSLLYNRPNFIYFLTECGNDSISLIGTAYIWQWDYFPAVFCMYVLGFALEQYKAVLELELV